MEQLIAAAVYAAATSVFWLVGVMFQDLFCSDEKTDLSMLFILALLFGAGLGMVASGYGISQIPG